MARWFDGPRKVPAGPLHHQSPLGQRLQRQFQGFSKIKIDDFQVHLSRFDFGKVQNVVNYREQGIA